MRGFWKITASGLVPLAFGLPVWLRNEPMDLVATARPSPAANPAALADNGRAEFTEVIPPFLKKHCVSCHGGTLPESGLSLAGLTAESLSDKTRAGMWLSVLEQVSTGHMPPVERPRPSRLDAARVVAWIRQSLVRTGHANELDFPEKGNLIPHELLFGPGANLSAKPASPSRIWRVSPFQYRGLWTDLGVFGSTDPKNAKRFELATRAVPVPFSTRGGPGFQDFASLYRIDEAETEQLLLNARVVADKLIGVVPDRKSQQATAKQGPKPLMDIFNSSTKPTDGQIDAALSHIFRAVLRRDPSSEERTSHAQFATAQFGKFGNKLGLRNMVAAVVLHPESLFRLELGNGQPDAHGRVILAPRELAFAIAFGLTDEPPDQPLIDVLTAGKLRTREDAAREVKRLLDDPKTPKPRILRFSKSTSVTPRPRAYSRTAKCSRRKAASYWFATPINWC